MAKQPEKPDVLDTATLARMSNLQLLAKTVVEGFILGLHKSPFRGFSVEFAEYRPYVPGDDIKHIDWKVYAKSDKHYLKLFEEETNLASHVILDASGSMAYGSGEITKFQYAARMAACLAYFMMGQRDATGLVVFDTEIREILPPRLRPTHLQHIINVVQSCEPGGETDLAQPLHAAAESIKKRGLVVVISDLLGEIDALKGALQHLKFGGHDVIVFQVLDPHELEFPFDNLVEFTDLETGQRLRTSGRAAREEYLKEFNAHQEAVRETCGDLKIDHVVYDTRQPLDMALAEYLYRRGRAG
ncbi:MAG: DUF58 domain-containing protein [Planctomycetota bacterium]|nr:DUF58 domain-containing protein [Planctomycetota bacterium]